MSDSYMRNSRMSSDIRCSVLMRVGTRGRRKTFSINPISESIALTPAGLPSTKRSEKRSVKRW